MIRRTRDVALVNSLVGRDFPGTDMAELLGEPLHICLVDGESGVLFAWRGPGIYEAHIFFAVRGKAAIRLGHELLKHMRREYGAKLFWALIPTESRNVIMFTRLMGWKSHGPVETRGSLNELFVENGECLQQ